MSESEPFVAETTIYVRYAETDSMRIVHHSNYIVYFEEGRSAYARQRGTPYSELESQGAFLAVTEVHVRYSKPAKYDQRITIRTWLETLKSRGMTFAYEIIDAKTDEKLVTGWSKHICLDADGNVQKIPASWQQWTS